MLTVNSEELSRLDYTGFSEDDIIFIKCTFVLFQHFSFAEYTPDGTCACLDGSMFGISGHAFDVEKMRCGIRVKVLEKSGGDTHALFAITFWKEVGSTLKYDVYKISM